jgi:hypothetical protein
MKNILSIPFMVSWLHKEVELVLRGDKWSLNLVIESPDSSLIQSGSTMGVDVGENNLAASSAGQVIGGAKLRDKPIVTLLSAAGSNPTAARAPIGSSKKSLVKRDGGYPLPTTKRRKP